MHIWRGVLVSVFDIGWQAEPQQGNQRQSEQVMGRQWVVSSGIEEYGPHQDQTKQTKMMQAKICVHVCKLDKVTDQC